MNDTKSSSEPVEEPTATDERRADVASAVDTPDAAQVWTAPAEPAAETKVWTAEADAEDDTPYVPGAYSTRLYDADETPSSAYAADAQETVVVTPAAETVAVAPVAPAQQPIFVQAPEAPLPRGNRAAAGAIGLLAALVFAVLYLSVGVGLLALTTSGITGDQVVTALLASLGSFSLWVPVAVFFFAFWLLGAIINRGRWGVWVVLGILVGVASYAGHIAGVLFQAPFWTLTAREGGELAGAELLSPLAVAAFIIGRELTIWFGAWVAARGRRVTELNIEAQREYERTLEAGPKLYAS